MKERTLMEQIVAILGVLVGTIAWVIRLLFSLVKSLLSGGSGSSETGTGTSGAAGSAKTYATDVKHKGESVVSEAREKGESLIEEARHKGETLISEVKEKTHDLTDEARHKAETLVGDAKEKTHDLTDEARHKVEGVMHRGEGDETSGGEARFDAEGSAAGDRSDVSATQHSGIGGVPEAPGFTDATGTTGEGFGEQSTSGLFTGDDESTASRMTDGIPNLEEPGEGIEAQTYGSESVSPTAGDAASGYAGQAMSESDIGIDRGDSISGFADSEDRSGGEFRGWVSDEVNLERDEEATGDEYDGNWVEDQVDTLESETGGGEEYDTSWVTDQINADDDEDDDDDDEEVPAASRGWEQPEDDVLKDDPLYGDIESSGVGGEVDLRNDEAPELDGAGMHIIDSPDEPFIEDEAASESLGFSRTGTEPAFDTTTGGDIDVDEIGEDRIALGEAELAADALGQPIGGDAASGDLGPEESDDDATRAPGASRPDGDVAGAYDGSGVDQFAESSVAESMLDDVTSGAETDRGSFDSGTAPADMGDLSSDASEDTTGERGSDTGSIAWASSAGVIDRDLAKPLSSDELLSGSDSDAGTDADADSMDEVDAGKKDVAADVAQDLDAEMGEGETATETTMSGAGQSAGAMTAEDVEEGGDETLSDSGSVETGGVPATDGEGEAGSADAETDADASMGTSGGSFNDVLPETEYASNVGYDTLQVDDMESTGRDDFSESSFLTETSTSGNVPATTGVTETRDAGRETGKVERKRGNAPDGAVRGDGTGTCPPGYPIKGNASSRIYHRPTDSSYEPTIPEFCFATEDDAKAAGFRPRKN